MTEQSPESLTQYSDHTADVSLSGLSMAARQRISNQYGVTQEEFKGIELYSHPVIAISRSARFAPGTVDTSEIGDSLLS